MGSRETYKPFMPTTKLENYLRTYRRRAGLSQDEMAFLLGAKDGAKVSRYERLARRPGLETAFAYEVVFRVHASELIAGVFDEVERETLRRARRLADQLAQTAPDRLTERKLEALRAALGASARP